MSQRGETTSFIPSNPEATAEDYRKSMIQSENGERRYLLAILSGTEQTKDTEVVAQAFRVRDYISTRRGSDWTNRWLHASSKEVFSTDFLGLDESGKQKLEFQNPPYAAAFRLGGDPQEYNFVFTVQVNGCTYECCYCYVPRELNNPHQGKGAIFSASQILDNFLEAKRCYSKKGISVNVIRLSGGEVMTLVPELIVDVSKGMNRRNMSRSTYLWVDTNLSTPKYLRNLEDELKTVLRQRNVGVVGCLKAVGNKQTGKEYFARLTKGDAENFPKQFETIEYIVNELQADFYLYILPIISTDKHAIRGRLEECVAELRRIHEKLPLRTNMLNIVETYAPTETNLVQSEKEGRPIPKYDQEAALAVWYEILRSHYDEEDLMKYRAQVPLR